MKRRAAIFGASGGIGAALVQALADAGWSVAAGSRSGMRQAGDLITPFHFDFGDEATIAQTARQLSDHPPELVIVATGVLTLANGARPERTLRKLDPETMIEVLRTNTVGPAIVAKHVLPMLPRDRRAVFAALSARVGSMGDNRLGGWHSYRASKAALNMLLRNFAIELVRTHPLAVVAGLHPGTVATGLSAPFQGNVSPGQLITPSESADHLLAVIERLTPADSGGVFDWRGARLPD